MYFGEAHTVVDDKGRITIPRRFRDVMDHEGHLQWFMTRGFDQCIFLVPRNEWDKLRSENAKYSLMDGEALDVHRALFGGVTEVRPDNQGRIPVPSYLREYAGIERDAVLVGVDRHLELWGRERWDQYQRELSTKFKNMAANLLRRTANGANEHNSAKGGMP